MNWIKITNADLEQVLNKGQLDILKAAEFASAGRDIVGDIIASAVARIRAEVAACSMNTLDADHLKIPFELKECALNLALEALQSRLPTLNLGDSIDRRAELARQTLLRVAKGELPVAQAIYGIRSAQKTGLAVCKFRKNKISKSSMEGL